MRSPPHPPPPTYSWVALSLAMSAPSIQTSCPTFVSQTFSVAESLEQRVPTSSIILIPHLSPRNKYKSRRWFPILKISHQDILCSALSLGCCNAFQMIVYLVASRWWKALRAIYLKEKKTACGRFFHWSQFFLLPPSGRRYKSNRGNMFIITYYRLS